METNSFCAIQALGEREEQEDSYGICYEHWPSSFHSPECFVLADGMGGHNGGAIASQIAVDAAKLRIAQAESFNDGLLFDSLSSANASLRDCLKLRPELKGMGTTFLMVTVEGGFLRWVSVGDSPLFGVTSNFDCVRLNEDHSMTPVLRALAEKKGDAFRKEDEPKSNQLRSAVSGESIELYELNNTGIPIDEWQYIVMASDGVESLSEQELIDVLKIHSQKNLCDKAIAIVDAVESKGKKKQDNTTVILLDATQYKAQRNEI